MTEPVPPIIAIPTTAGTGSEVGRSGVVTLRPSNRKAVLCGPKLLPQIALCDPELTHDLPSHITAATGMDALTHNIEAYLSTAFHPICDAIALGGVRRVAQNLRKAVHDGHDPAARSNMLLASSMGAIAFQKDLGAAHALAHPLSTIADVPHGLANAILLPHVLAFNKPAVASRLKDVAQAMGLATDGVSDDDAADLAIEAVQDLSANIGIPATLSASAFAPTKCRKWSPRPSTTPTSPRIHALAQKPTSTPSTPPQCKMPRQDPGRALLFFSAKCSHFTWGQISPRYGSPSTEFIPSVVGGLRINSAEAGSRLRPLSSP